jgi:hypothetical protein
MKLTKLLPARIERGRIIYHDPREYSKVISALNGQEVTVSIKPPSKSRSNQQNRYYHGVVLALVADTTGYSTTECHELMKAMFLPDNKVVAGKMIHFSRSTTGLTTTEFEDYLKHIREWASVDLGIYIPQPNEVDF